MRYASLIVEGALTPLLTQAIGTALSQQGVRHRFDGQTLEREQLGSLDRRAESGTESKLRRNGCYVITGGGGGVGRLLCRWLAREYQAKVCVVGRSPVDGERRAMLLAHGVTSYVQANVADQQALAGALNHFKDRYGAIDGVFHLAGATADRLLINKHSVDVERVLLPKIAGSLNLWALDSLIQPGFVCNFSSLSGLLGNVGQADYAAGNVFVDELTDFASRHDRAGHARWQSINWGLWASEGIQMALGQSDLLALTDEQGFAALQTILNQTAPRALAFAGSRGVLGGLNPSASAQAVVGVPSAAFLPSIAGVSEWLGTLVYTFSRIRDVPPDESLVALGVTSSALISIVSAIEHRLASTGTGVSLSKALIFDYSSVSALAEYLLATHPQAMAAAFASEVPAPLESSPVRYGMPATPQTSIELEHSLTEWVREVIRRFSGIVDPAIDDNLLERGVDSVASINIATEIARRLSTQTPVTISKTLLFEYSSVRQIVNFLLDRYQTQITEALNAAAAEPASVIVPPLAAPAKAPVLAKSVSNVSPGVGAHYRPDDIAIIGLAGEFPGADSLDQLWALLESGSEAISVVPAQRWGWQLDYSADPKQQGTSYGRHGGFLRRAKQFDPAFFSITPVEAVRIDPQERRLLEMAYHALEDTGHFGDPQEDTGVFTAAMFGHYQNLNAASAVISSSFASIANRISYTFNFQGPSLCVDTMCSGSLTALHLAINSLRNGECTQALVGAVNIMPHPGKFKLLSAGRFLSPSGRCHSFGIEADGYVPGEGAIALMIKPLAQAQAHGDRIHGVIRATALNSGGRSSGFTVPSARAQEKVIRQALSRAGVAGTDIDYVEAHGTGTSLGDPIEINALSAAYGKRDGARRHIGSIKSNIGHLESAAGLAGLAKILLQFRHQTRVPTLNCEIENPWLNLASTDFQLPRITEPWTATAPLLAGLSSFGAGGANAHMIVQQYLNPELAPTRQEHYLLPVSARTPLALKTRINDLLAWIDSHPQASLGAVAYTLGTAREHFGHRACFIVDSLAQFKQRLLDADDAAAASHLSPSTLQALQASYLAGEKLNFAALHETRMLVSLPHYPFEEQSYWDDQLVSSTPVAEGIRDLVAAPVPVCFQPFWELEAARAPDAAQRQGSVVFCSPQQARALTGQAQIVVVTVGDSLRLEEHFAQVRCDSVDDCLQVLRRYAQSELGRLPWLINLLQSSDEDMQAPWTRWQFTLAKAISASGAGYRMAFVHEDGLDVWPTPAAGALSRLFRVLQMEQPRFELVSMTVTAQAFEHVQTLIRCARDELATAPAGFSASRQVAGERWQARVREVDLPAADRSRFRIKGVYLITGGMGLIGLAVAARLIGQFDARVVLVGRSPASEATRQKLAGLPSSATVEYISADITDSAAVSSVIQSVIERHGTLHGVLHCAGITCDGLLRNKRLKDFQDVIAVKLNGARNLDSATAPLALDFFVLFSSVSGLFGNVGQADYAVANHYLDLFASGRQRQVAQGHRHGLSLSVNWPLWLDEQGGDADERVALGRYLLDNYGLQPLTPAGGADLLVRLIDCVGADTAQIAPFVGDSEKIRRSIGPDGLRNSAPLASSRVPTVEGYGAAATPGRLKPLLKKLLTALTGLSADSIDDRSSFGDMGLNSVMLQQLAQDIEERFKVPMAPNTLFTYNSVLQLLKYLHERGAQAGELVQAADTGTVSLPPVLTDPAGPEVTAPATDDQRIAIIGMDGRLPGSSDLAGFWEGLVANRSAITAVERWPDKACHAGIIPDIEHFDARFFGVSAREAMLMDPQHRLFLQACYNTLLDAGYTPSSLKRVGVFAGVQFSDYQTLLQRSGQNFHPYAATGNAHAMLANRVSYLFDFEGPSQSIDTACSSALVAVNRAVMALQRGECDYALAGAVSLLIDSDITEAAQSMGVLSPNFRCATFDSEADGYVRAEGVGSLLLKRLVDARRDGDSIHAVIEAAEENHGGRANSLTAPNPHAQKRLLLAAYTPSLAARVSYIETHGTGTRLGDPVEIDALKGAWHALAPGQERSVLLGSVKTNVGHLEPAAAIASLFKVILAFKHRLLPANLHFRTLNSYIDFQHSPFQVLERNTPWEEEDRVAGISSFGFGGTNAHVVLSGPPPVARVARSSSAEHLVVLSARSRHSLLAMRQALLRHLDSPKGRLLALADIALTLGAGREHFEYRLAWNVSTFEELLAALRSDQDINVRHLGRASEHSDAPEIAGQWPDAREQYLHGGDVPWASMYPEAGRIHLPGYVFDTRKYWFDDELQVQSGNR